VPQVGVRGGCIVPERPVQHLCGLNPPRTWSACLVRRLPRPTYLAALQTMNQFPPPSQFLLSELKSDSLTIAASLHTYWAHIRELRLFASCPFCEAGVHFSSLRTLARSSLGNMSNQVACLARATHLRREAIAHFLNRCARDVIQVRAVVVDLVARNQEIRVG